MWCTAAVGRRPPRTLAAVSLTLIAAPGAEPAPPGNFQTSLIVGDGLNGPSGFEIAPDGRIFILERSGKIKIVKNGQLLPTPFADLPSEDTGDRGLIGIAFDPDFGVSNHYVYFYYTGHDLLNHLVRFNAAEDVGTEGPFELFRTTLAVAAAARGRQHPVRPRRQAVLRGGRQRQRRERPGPQQPAREDPADQQGRLDPCTTTRSPASPGKLGAIWAYGHAEPVALPVRQRHRAALRRRRRRLLAGRRSTASSRAATTAGRCRRACASRTAPGSSTRASPIRTPARARRSRPAPCTAASMFPAEYRGDFFFGDYAQGLHPQRRPRRERRRDGGPRVRRAGRQRRRPQGGASTARSTTSPTSRARCIASPTTRPRTCRWRAPPPT